MVHKSGKLSCCARGGSWFGSCGSGGSAQVRHTWSEGFRVCEARQFHDSVGQEVRDSLAQSKSFAGAAIAGLESKAAFVFVSTTASTLTTMSGATQVVSMAANESVITPMRKSIAHTTVLRLTSRAETVAPIKRERSAVDMLAGRSSIPAENGTMSSTMRIGAADSVRAAPGHTGGGDSSAGVGADAREWGKLRRMVAYGSAVLLVVCWY